MKKIVLAAGILIALVAVVAVAGCVGSDKIVGTWETSASLFGVDLAKSTLTFDGSGSGTMKGSVLGITSENPTKFTWKKAAEGSYTLTFEDGKEKSVAVTFAEDGKTMKFDNVEYKKV
ncbi:MAG TPA: hypothetical protein O0X39_03595 [Methanocorpusculum sp.]|nr:hypothetical protein [Methanocorpusculum sp.]